MTESLYPRISVYPCQPFHIHLPTVAKQQISGSVIILIPGNFPLSLPFSVLFRHIYFRTDGILLHHLQKRYHFSGLSSHNFSILQNFRFRNFYTVSHGQAAFPAQSAGRSGEPPGPSRKYKNHKRNRTTCHGLF